MSVNYAREIEVESHSHFDSVRVDDPTLKAYVMNVFKAGRSNEHAVRITGLPVSVVSKYRNEFDKEKRNKDK
jgi:hypothetical protein